MYFSDFAVYTYSIEPKDKSPSLCIGWLDNEHPYKQGAVSTEFINRLWIFCQSFVEPTLGYHQCLLCHNAPLFGILTRHKSKEIKLGSAEIRAIGEDGSIYAAPNLIFHYVTEHHYQPPTEFIKAVLQGPLPDSPQYVATKQDRNWTEIPYEWPS